MQMTLVITIDSNMSGMTWRPPSTDDDRRRDVAPALQPHRGAEVTAARGPSAAKSGSNRKEPC